MAILVTGGTGYIGSHICVELLNEDYSVIIVDNLVNSERGVVDRIEQITGSRPLFYQTDVADEKYLDFIFSTHKIDGVIHLAGLKAVGESVQKPLLYYKNNVLSTLSLVEKSLQYGVEKFVFSSSATVYGDNQSPLLETMELRRAANPYGQTKVISEQILTDSANVNPNFSVALLRYFNPVGAHPSGLIGEAPRGIPNNLMPYITQVAKGKLERLTIFGDDYPTKDGTGVRDYLHVVDLARGHLAALACLQPGVEIFNLGTGEGTSVLELVHAFQEATDIQIRYRLAERREGDLAVVYADPTKAKSKLGWAAGYSLVDMCRDAWRFEKNNTSR